LGLALLHHCFGEFYRRGIAKAGMHVFRQMDAYEKELRAGHDLTTQVVESHPE